MTNPKKLSLSLKIAIVVLTLFLVTFLYVSAYCPVEYSIYMAFASAIATFISSFFPIFTDDKINGNIVILLIGIGIGVILTDIALPYLSNCKIALFEIDRIGNTLTVFSMIFYFLGSIKTIISSRNRDI